MAELTPIESIQPCLLDRLTDEQPDTKVESRNKRVVSLQKFKEGVLRDLRWLFNASPHTEEEGWSEFPEVERSVLNYGIRDLSGLVTEGLDFSQQEKEIYEAIILFEPRVIENSLTVRMIRNEKERQSSQMLRFEIQGELWAKPVPEQFFAKTEIDLETGECILRN